MKKLLIFLLVIMPFVFSHAQMAPPPTTKGVIEGVAFRVNPNSLKNRITIELHMYYRSLYDPATYGQLRYSYGGILDFDPGQNREVLYQFPDLFGTDAEYAYFEFIDAYTNEIVIIDCLEDKEDYFLPQPNGGFTHIKKTWENYPQFGLCGVAVFEITHLGGQ